MKAIKNIQAAFAAVLLVVSSGTFADFTGPVVAIVDGDTLDVLVDSRPVRVRLAQIDAPERTQAYGTRSRQALSSLVFRKTVTVVEAGPDRYGRILGTVYLPGSLPGVIDAGFTNVNGLMVGEGMAWAYRQYVTDPSLIQLEAKARAAHRGLWADPAPVEPWLFRRGNK